jgi:hypothetical protein
MIFHRRLDHPIPMNIHTTVLNPTFRENFHSDMKRFYNHRENLTTEGIFKRAEPTSIKIETKDPGTDWLKKLGDNLAKNKPF